MICVVCGEDAVTDQTCQSGLQHFLVLLTFWPNNPLLWGCPVHSRFLAAPLASTHQKLIVGESYNTQNIQINKVISENKKCVFCFAEKTKWAFCQPNILQFCYYQYIESFLIYKQYIWLKCQPSCIKQFTYIQWFMYIYMCGIYVCVQIYMYKIHIYRFC